MLIKKFQDRLRRKKRIRARVTGTSERPRMSVYRSLLSISVQIIDDTTGKTLVSGNTKSLKAKPNKDGAKKLGAFVAEQAKAKKISSVVFDRNAYRYHGRIKELAEAAREGGLQF